MPEVKQTVKNGNNNILAGGDVYLTKVVNNERHIEFYEKDIMTVIEQLDKHIDLFEDLLNEYVEDDKFDYAEKIKKNRLNNLSNHYFEIMKEKMLPCFNKLDVFLKNPQNKKLKTKYLKISIRLNIIIETHREKFNHFEEIIYDISDTLMKRIDDCEEFDPLVITVILNYMYWNCDIGRKK